MYINLMRYRNGKFGISATELTKNNKRINSETLITNMKRFFGEKCIEYRIDTREGIQHIWTFQYMHQVTEALGSFSFPSQDNDEPEE